MSGRGPLRRQPADRPDARRLLTLLAARGGATRAEIVEELGARLGGPNGCDNAIHWVLTHGLVENEERCQRFAEGRKTSLYRVTEAGAAWLQRSAA